MRAKPIVLVPLSCYLAASLSALESSGSTAEDLCLACGLCCNGVLFADVKLQPDDDAGQLEALDLPLSKGAGAVRCSQPCAAYDGYRCGVYAHRPRYCREFECLLLKSTKTGRTSSEAASRVIRTARERADRVRSLLLVLGDTNEHLSLSKRYRRTVKRLEKVSFDEVTAERYGELTLAVHDLNLLLSEAFYPGPG